MTYEAYNEVAKQYGWQVDPTTGTIINSKGTPTALCIKVKRNRFYVYKTSGDTKYFSGSTEAIERHFSTFLEKFYYCEKVNHAKPIDN